MYIDGVYIDEEDKKNLRKCFKFIDKLIAKAASERDRKGYREGLGRVSQHFPFWKQPKS